MHDNLQEAQANKISGLFEFLKEHYPQVRDALLFLCDHIENGLVAKIFPKGIIATRLKPAVPKIRELIKKIDELLQ